jgi:UDP-glucuronate 4-epimerase
MTDIAAGIVAAGETPLGYEVVNLGRGEPVLLSDFVTLVESSAGQKAHLTPQAMQSADVAYTYADITKARRLFLGYYRKFCLRGVSRVLLEKIDTTTHVLVES